jgi:hypothetical protein
MVILHEVYKEPSIGFFQLHNCNLYVDFNLCYVVMYLMFAGYFINYCSLLVDVICCFTNCYVRFNLFDS